MTANRSVSAVLASVVTGQPVSAQPPDVEVDGLHRPCHHLGLLYDTLPAAAVITVSTLIWT